MLLRAVLLLLGLLVSSVSEAAKWGLLIEIGQYPAGRDTLGTARDAYWMSQTLARQGFSLTVLTNRSARAEDIRRALDALVDRCRLGDKVVIHYGGHGTQLPDQPGGDEKDQLDEALVPYDAPLPGTPGYTQSRGFIRDDELGTYLDRLRQAVGYAGHILLLIDACHSGTLSRGQSRLRTDNIRLSAPPDTSKLSTTSGWLDGPVGVLRTAAATTGAVVLIAGAGASQKQYELLDYDNRLVGPVSFGFAEAMLSIDEQTTYRALFGQLWRVVRREALRQRSAIAMPTLEGDTLARLLGGDLVLPSLMTRVQLEAQRRFRQLKGGLQGYLPGSTVTVRVGRGATADMLTGRVVDASPLESVVELTQQLPTVDSIWLQTSLLSQAFRPGTVRVTLADFDRRADVATLIKDMPGVVLVPNEADWLIRPAADGVALCRAGDGESIELFGAKQLASLPDRLMAHAQAAWLRDLSMTNERMQVEASIVPARLDASADRVLATLPAERRNGLSVLRTNQQAVFTVRNTGTLPFYVTLIDIQPDAGLSVPLPNGRYPIDSMRLRPGQLRSYIIPDIAPPLGLETFKLLLSPKPANLESLVQSRGAHTDSTTSANPLVELLTARLRNSPRQSIRVDEAGLYTFQFWIDGPTP